MRGKFHIRREDILYQRKKSSVLGSRNVSSEGFICEKQKQKIETGRPTLLVDRTVKYVYSRKVRYYSARHLNPTKSNSNGNITDLVFRFFHGFLLISTDFHGFLRFSTDFPRIFSDFSRILSRSQRFSHRYSLITLFKKC